MKRYFSFFLGLFASLLFVTAALAGPNFTDHQANLNIITKKSGVEKIDAQSYAGRVIQIAFSVAGIVFLVLMVYAGFRWMLARGQEEYVNKARDTITGAILGLAFIVGAFAITSFVTTRLLSGEASQTTTSEGATLGGEALGCCADLKGSSNATQQWACNVSTQSQCETNAKKKSANDIFTTFKWTPDTAGNGCNLVCIGLNE